LGSPIDREHPLARGLVGCWLMNEGSGNKIQDLSGNGNTGTFVNHTKWTGGRFGSCLSFDGTDDYVLFGKSFNQKSFTKMAWINCTNATTRRNIFGTVDSIGSLFCLYTSNQLSYYDYDLTPAGWYGASSATNVSLTIWHQVAVTYSGAAITLYLDGCIVVGPTAATGTPRAYNGIGTYNITNSPWLGLIDNAQVWDRALTASEIAQLYRDPFAMFRRPRIELWLPGLPAAGGHAYTETINDGIGIADAETSLRAWVKSIVNSLGLADIAARVAAQSRTEADGVGLTDAASSPVGYIKPMQDNVGMDDAASSLIGYIRTMQDGIGVADAASRLFAATRTNADTVGMDDAASSAWSAIRQVADDLGLTDAIAGILGCLRTINDGLGLTDDDAHSQAVARTLADEIGIIDTIARIFIVARLITDLEGMSDQIVRGSILTIADAMGMTDDVDRLLACLRTLADSMGVTDSTSRVAASLRTISEALGLTDVMSEQFSGLVAAATIFLLLKKHR
jgi:hypothetical protein